MNYPLLAFRKQSLGLSIISCCLALLLGGPLQAQELTQTQGQEQAQAQEQQQAQVQEIKPQTSFTSPVTTKPVLDSFTPLSDKEKFHHYLHHTYGPARIARTAFTAGINQWRNHTPEWGQGMEGYGKRFASKFGQSAIKRSLQLGIGIWRDEDPRYFRSEDSGFWPRTRHALAYTFVTRKDDGSTGVAVSRLTSAFGAGLLSRTWQPERKRTIEDGLRAGAVSIATDAGYRVLQEFWRDIRHRFRR